MSILVAWVTMVGVRNPYPYFLLIHRAVVVLLLANMVFNTEKGGVWIRG